MSGTRRRQRFAPFGRWAAPLAVAEATWTRWPPPFCFSMPWGCFVAERRAARVLGAALGMAATLAACGGEGAPVRRVTIPQGSTFAAAADSLESAGVLRSPRLFRLYASVTGRD